MPRHKIVRGDEIGVYFQDDRSAPYRMFGTFVYQDENVLVITGTVGDEIGKDFHIPQKNVKMIEVTKKARNDGDY